MLRTFASRIVALLTTAEGSFVIKVDSKPNPTSDPSVRFHALGYLESRAFLHAPRVILTRSGEVGGHIYAGVACVLEYVRNEPQPTPQQWRDFGAAVASLNAHSDYDRPFAISIGGAIAELDARARGQAFGTEMRALLKELSWLSDVPATALVHGEVNCANGGVRSDGTTVLLDWDQAGRGLAALDYGYPLITQFIAESTHLLDVEPARAFYRAYRDSGGVIDIHQCLAASFLHALRYMWWGDTKSRWRRIQFARDHRSALVDAVSG